MSTFTRKPLVRSGKACTFVPRSYHIMVVKHDSPERIVSVSAPKILEIRVYYLHSISGEVEHATTLRLTGPITLLFTATTDYRGYAYIQHYSHKLTRFACSCLEGKTQGFCKHCEEMEKLRTPPAIVEVQS